MVLLFRNEKLRPVLLVMIAAAWLMLASCSNPSDPGGGGDPTTLSLTIADASVVEGNAGTCNLEFTVTISTAPAAGTDVTVDWATTDGTATTADNDYATSSGTLTFSNSSPLTQQVAVTVNCDLVEEPDETVVVTLSNAANADIGDATATGTITNDDTAVTGGTMMVDPTAPGTKDGQTWATAYHTIQEAMDASNATGGGEVWVAAGTYTSGSVDLTVPVVAMKADVSLYGGFEGYAGGTGAMETDRSQRDHEANPTILDGEDTMLNVVFSQSAGNSRLDGFTVTRGNDDGDEGGGMYLGSHPATVANCLFLANHAERGGGLYIAAHSITVTNCEFEGNTAKYGAGMYNYRSYPQVTDCQFTDNVADQAGGGMYNTNRAATDDGPVLLGCTFTGNIAGSNGGGGMYSKGTSPHLTSCTFAENSAGMGGGMYNKENMPTLTTCPFSRNNGGIEGGGMHNHSASPELTNCVFAHNEAGRGGGMYNYSFSSPVLTGCDFTGNISTSNNVNTGGGGMINTLGCAPVLTDCTFAANSAVRQGGGMHNYSSSPTLVDCFFSLNTADHRGGGLHNDNNSSPVLENCRFSNNRATSGGGGMSNYRNAHPRMSGCLFVSYRAHIGGGMFNTDDSDPVLANCLFTRNKAWNAGGALRNEDGSPMLINCILYGDSTGCLYPELGNDVYSHPRFSGCNIQSCGGSDAWMVSTGTDDGGNIDEEPLWLDEGANNFELQAGSPCIDAGNNIDIYDLDDDDDITELLPLLLDYYGNPRFVDDPATVDTGSGIAPIIDMGVHEF